MTENHNNNNNDSNGNGGKERGTFLVIEPRKTNQESAPTYINCNSQNEFILPKSTIDGDGETDSTRTVKVGISTYKCQTFSSTSTTATKMLTTSSSSKSSPPPLTSSSSVTTCTATNYSPKQVNESLNLNLGLPVNPRNIKIIRLVCKIMSFFLSLVESAVFRGWDTIPLSLRQSVESKQTFIFK